MTTCTLFTRSLAAVLAGLIALSPAAAAESYRFYRFVPELRVSAPAASPAPPSEGTAPGTGAPPVAADAQPALSVSTAALAFGNVEVGQPSTLTLLVSNSGAGGLTFTAAPSVTGAGFQSSTNCPTTLAANASCQVQVQFMPSAAGAATGTLALSGGTAATSASVQLTGNGFVRASMARWGSTNLAFSNVLLGSTNTRTVQLYNDGNATADYSSFVALPEGFSVNASGCASVAAGGSCSVSFTFAPAQAKVYSASGIAPSVGQHSNLLTLTGQGVAATLDLSTGSLDFGGVNVGNTSVAKTVVIFNPTQSSVSLGTVTYTGDFTASTDCPASLPSGDSCNVNVTFTPTTGAQRTGTLTIAASTGNHTVSLTGWGNVPLTASLSSDFDSVQAPTGNFAATNVGSSRTVKIFVKAGGNVGSLNVGATLSGSSEFQLVAAEAIHLYYQAGWGNTYETISCGGTLTATSVTNCKAISNNGTTYKDLVLTVRFAPTSVGDKYATLSVSHNGSNVSPLVLSLAGVAQGVPTAELSASSLTFNTSSNPADVGSSSTADVTLSNNGTAALTLNGAPVVAGASQFSLLSTTCSGSIQAGGSCKASVGFAPTDVTSVAGTLTFSTSLGNKTVALSGTGLAAVGSLTAASGSSADFGSVAVYSSLTRNFVFTNTGTKAATGVYATVTGTSLSLTANTCGTAASPVSVAAAGTCTYSVTYSPTSAGVVSGASTQVVSSALNSPTALALTAASADGAWNNVVFLAGFDNGNLNDERFGAVGTLGRSGSGISNRTLSTADYASGGSSLFGEPSIVTSTAAYVQYPSRSEYDLGTGDFTVELWFKRTLTNSTYSGTLFDASTTGTTCDDGLCLLVDDTDTSNSRVMLHSKGGPLYGPTVAKATYLNNWNHVALVRASGTLTLYLNGVGVATRTDNNTYPAKAYRIGSRVALQSSPSDYRPFRGYIDEVVVTKQARYRNSFTPTGRLVQR